MAKLYLEKIAHKAAQWRLPRRFIHSTVQYPWGISEP